MGLGVGLAYGFIFRITSRFHWRASRSGVINVAFLIGVPVVMGFITVFISEREARLDSLSGGNDGEFPFGSLVFDGQGNLSGTADAGGSWGSV